MRKINEPPVFVIGSPKAGSSSLHDFFSLVPGLVLPVIKDTHYLSRKEFSLEKYLEYFVEEGRLVEVDQNVGAYDTTFNNIRENFDSGYVVYVVRDSKSRVHSAVKWLLKVQHCTSVEDCFDRESEWIVGHGDYVAAIERMLQLSDTSNVTSIVIRFERLVKNPEVLKTLIDILNIETNTGLTLPRSNEAGSSRLKVLTRFAKWVALGVRNTRFESSVLSLKNVSIVQKILFTNKATKKVIINDEFLKDFYEVQDSYVEKLFSNYGLICITKGMIRRFNED